MFGIYNLLSLICGIAAVLLSLMGLFLKKKSLFSYLGASSGMIALCSQVAAYNTLVKKRDWSALMDTSDFTLFAAVALAVITIVLNFIILVKRK